MTEIALANDRANDKPACSELTIGESIERLWHRWYAEENPYLMAISLFEADAGVGVVLALELERLRLNAQTGLTPAAVADD